MQYELTRYGEEYLETSGARLDKIWEKAPVQKSKEGLTRIKRTSALDRLSKRVHILDKVKKGEHPIDTSFDFLKEGPRKERGKNALRKELDSMLKARLIREAPSSKDETVLLGSTPGWEQKIQYELGKRSASQITASQKEYEKHPPILYIVYFRDGSSTSGYGPISELAKKHPGAIKIEEA